MNTWKTQFDNHAAHSTISNLETTLNQYPDRYVNDVQREIRDRLLYFIDYIRSVLEEADPNIVSQQILNEIHAHLANAIGQLNQFYSNNNQGHLVNANGQIDALLTGNRILSFVNINKKGIILKRTLESMNKRLNKSIDEITERVDAIDTTVNNYKTNLKEFDDEIINQKAKLDTNVTDYQKQFLESESSRSNMFTELFDKNKSKYETNFEGLVESNSEDFEKLKNDTQEKINTFSENAEKTMTNMNNLYDQAKQVLRYVTDGVVTSDYQKRAKKAGYSQLIFTILAVTCFFGVAFGAMFVIYLSIKATSLDWQLNLFRVVTVFALALPGFYAAKVAEKSRKTASRYRQMALELATIDPFLESLPEAIRNELKKNLADRMFAQPDFDEKESDSIGIDELFKLVQTLIKAKA